MTTHLSPTAEEDRLTLEHAVGQEAKERAKRFIETELEERIITREEYNEILYGNHPPSLGNQR